MNLHPWFRRLQEKELVHLPLYAPKKGIYISGKDALLKYSPHDRVLQSEVKRHSISLLVEEFGDMLGLPHEDVTIEPVDKLNN